MDDSNRAAWAFDLDGVLWTGCDPIPGAAEAVGALIEAGHRVAFVTNNSFATVAEQEAKLAAFGIAGEGRVITSAMAGATLVEEGERVYVLGGPGIVEAVQARGAVVVDGANPGDRPDAVLVGLDRNLSYERLSGAVLALQAGARFVATNTDSTYPSERGMLPGGGSIVAAVQYATGAVPVVAGKPHDAQARLVRSVLGHDGVMIGDRPETDGRFASAMGYRFGLVLTGVTGRDDLPIEPEPSWVEDDVARLVPQILAEL